jgi:molecular chaperone HscB
LELLTRTGAHHFERLGLALAVQLDRSALESAYLARSSLVHPDRFVGGTNAVQRRAMEASAALNEAYRTLRDPVRRAEYLVRLGGIDLDSSDPVRGAPRMDQVFLMDMIERREQLQAARRDAGELAAMREQVDVEAEGVLDEALAALETALTRPGGLAPDPAGTPNPAVAAAARALVHHRYVQRLLDEIDAEHDG